MRKLRLHCLILGAMLSAVALCPLSPGLAQDSFERQIEEIKQNGRKTRENIKTAQEKLELFRVEQEQRLGKQRAEVATLAASEEKQRAEVKRLSEELERKRDELMKSSEALSFAKGRLSVLEPKTASK